MDYWLRGSEKTVWRRPIYLPDWRPNSTNARGKLLVDGITLRGISVDLASNPEGFTCLIQILQHFEFPSVIWLYHIATKDKLTSIGYKLRSKKFNERCRDREKRLTWFLTGRRFFYMVRPAYPVNDHIRFWLFTSWTSILLDLQTVPQINQSQEEPDTHQNLDSVFEEDAILEDQDHQLISPPVNTSVNTSHNLFNALTSSEVNTNDSLESDNDPKVPETQEPTDTSTPADSPDEAECSQSQDDTSKATSTATTSAAGRYI